MRAALIVDVDGVVSPVHGATAWGDDVEGGMRRTPVSPTLNRRLDVLADRPEVEPMWLTSWDSEMRRGMRFPGADWPTLAHQWAWAGPPVYDEAAARRRAGERWADNNWWKLWAVDAWLDQHPEVDTVVWCDDHLAKPFFSFHDSYDVEVGGALTREAAAAVELEKRGLRALLVAPATNVGLTAADVDRIEAFLDDPSPPTPRPCLPRDLDPPAAGVSTASPDERQSRPCATCDPNVWYLRYSPTFIECTVCHRTYYGRYDVTEPFGNQSHDRL